MSLADIHSRLAISGLLFVTFMALWGLFRFFRKEGVNSNYFGAAVIAEVLYILQGLLGLFIFITGSGELGRPEVHILYGIVTVLTIPGVYIYTRADESRRAVLIYALAFIFLIGITIRSMSTGG